MNGNDRREPSSTDWERLDQLADEDIDTSDIPPLDEAFFARAKLRLPKKGATRHAMEAHHQWEPNLDDEGLLP